MKRMMVAVLILAVLSFWVPCAGAEISKDLDPMVPVELQTTATNEGSVTDNPTTAQVSNVVSTADATVSEKKVEEQKAGEKKKSKSKKGSASKSSSKKSGKSGGNHSSKHSKQHKKGAQ
jgi:hypothetical protein